MAVKNKLVRYLIIMFVSFIVDSILRFYLPSSILKVNLTVIPYVGVMMFDLLNNTIDEDHRYIFAEFVGFILVSFMGILFLFMYYYFSFIHSLKSVI